MVSKRNPVDLSNRSLASTSTARRRLARPLELERHYVADRDAMLAALRVALGLPRALPTEREAA
jgi:hypothetical protein